MFQDFKERWSSFTTEQKISVWIFGVCGLFALFFSLYRVKALVSEPFLVDKTEITKAKLLIGETDEERLAKEKRIDTDGDTLSDWDELNVFMTNPNLKDSCGDGLTDNVRVATGKNLNCQRVAEVKEVSKTFVASPIFTGAEMISTVNSSSTDAKEQTQNEFEDNGTIQDNGVLPREPDAIRAALSGRVEKTKLDALTDAQLLELYDQAIVIQQREALGQTTTTQ